MRTSRGELPEPPVAAYALEGIAVNSFSFPNGARVDCHDGVAIWVWATFFAHAAARMGLSITTDGDGRTVRVESVHAPLYHGLDALIDLDTGAVLADRSEQDPIWPRGLSEVFSGDLKTQARNLADEELGRWETPVEERPYEARY